MRNKNTTILFYPGLLLLLIVVNLVYASYFIKDAYPSHNMISNLIMAAAPINNLGLPYRDYWDIYPPGIFIFLSPFEYLFHGETPYFKLFHILISIGMGWIVLKFLIRIFRRSALPVTLFFILYLVFSNYFYCILFHNAFLALFLSLSGLYLLSFSKKTIPKYFLSSLLFAFSAGMKETFLFTIFLPILYVTARYLFRDKKSIRLFLKNQTMILAGIGLVVAGNYLYLQLLGVKENYSEVTAYKSQLIGGGSLSALFNNLNPFNFADFSARFNDFSSCFFLHNYGGVYYLFLIPFLIFLFSVRSGRQEGKLKLLWNAWHDERGLGLLLCGFFILHFEGFQLLNKMQPNYTLQMVPALVLAAAFLYLAFKKKLEHYTEKKIHGISQEALIKKGVYFIPVLAFFWVLYPRFSNFKFIEPVSLSEYAHGFTLKKPEVQLPQKVKEVMGNDKRIFHVYGWGTPYFYYFSHTRPFSRFFIIHPNILGNAQIKELVEQFKKELPRVIVYTTYGADMDIRKFEDSSVRFEKLLEKCYEFYPAVIYPGYNCKGYYLLKDDTYFKAHPEEFIASAYR